jgi:hypothetical protein
MGLNLAKGFFWRLASTAERYYQELGFHGVALCDGKEAVKKPCKFFPMLA